MSYAEQLPLFDTDPRSHARADDPDTSHTAAAMLNAGRMLWHLLEQFGAEPLTAEQAADRAGYTAADGAWKRVSDLQRQGLIQDTPYRRTASTGRPQMVRAITHKGMAVLRQGQPVRCPHDPRTP